MAVGGDSSKTSLTSSLLKYLADSDLVAVLTKSLKSTSAEGTARAVTIMTLGDLGDTLQRKINLRIHG